MNESKFQRLHDLLDTHIDCVTDALSSYGCDAADSIIELIEFIHEKGYEMAEAYFDPEEKPLVLKTKPDAEVNDDGVTVGEVKFVF